MRAEPLSDLLERAEDFLRRDEEDWEGLSPIVEFVNGLLHDAILREASAVHMIPGPAAAKAHYRIAGMLEPVCAISNRLYNAVRARLKIIAWLDVANRKTPQCGRVVQSEGLDMKNWEFLVRTLPIGRMEQIVVKIRPLE